jgi:glutamate synthase domain-containing protein 3
MHRLWTDHAIWTRDYVVAALAGAPDAEAGANRLLRNQEDIGNAVVPLYGEEAGKGLTDLLKQHIMIAVDLVDAAMKGDNARFKREDKKWDRNAEAIAAFLAGANPYWPQDDVQDLLAQHLALTKKEVVARLEQDWEGDIAAFDDIMTEILTLADALSEGIVKQFPDQFGGQPAQPASKAPQETGGETGTEDGAVSREASSLEKALRRLWSDHVVWTRDYIVAALGNTGKEAALAGGGESEAAANRLLRNQEDIGNAIVPLYAEEAGRGLTDLLKQHILTAVDIIDLVRAGDFGERFEELDESWNQNAREIAKFLGGLNPHWPEQDVHDLLAQHLALTRQEVDARLFGDWEKDVATFDDIMTEILTVADALSAGIIKQFPEQFGMASTGAGGTNGAAHQAPSATGGNGESAGPISRSSSSDAGRVTRPSRRVGR